MLPIWRTISQKYVLSGGTRALSQSSHEPPEMQALKEEYSGESSNSCTNDSCTNDSVSLSMSRTLSSDPEAEVSARLDGGRRLADFIKNMESFADGRPHSPKVDNKEAWSLALVQKARKCYTCKEIPMAILA